MTAPLSSLLDVFCSYSSRWIQDSYYYSAYHLSRGIIQYYNSEVWCKVQPATILNSSVLPPGKRTLALVFSYIFPIAFTSSLGIPYAIRILSIIRIRDRKKASTAELPNPLRFHRLFISGKYSILNSYTIY